MNTEGRRGLVAFHLQFCNSGRHNPASSYQLKPWKQKITIATDLQWVGKWLAASLSLLSAELQFQDGSTDSTIKTWLEGCFLVFILSFILTISQLKL